MLVSTVTGVNVPAHWMEMAGHCLCVLYVLHAVRVVPAVRDMHWSNYSNLWCVQWERNTEEKRKKVET